MFLVRSPDEPLKRKALRGSARLKRSTVQGVNEIEKSMAKRSMVALLVLVALTDGCASLIAIQREAFH